MKNLVEKFSTESECREYIEQHNLDAMPFHVYSEDDGELIYFTVYHY